MPRTSLHLGLLAACTLLSATTAVAQTNAVIAGVVRDATGAVLPGVTVEVSSPALIEKIRTVMTDGVGQYKILELRPGVYTVTFALEGFFTVKREGIELTTGFTATVNGDMRVGSIAETVTVTGASPIVDIENVKQQVVMTREVVDNIPTGKYFQNFAVLIPGVVSSRALTASAGQDVGGQAGQSYASMAIHGGRANDLEIQLDGMSTSTWNRIDGSVILFSDGNISEYAIEVSGKSAETETGGLRINMIPREGGNQFKGSFSANFANDSLQSDNITQELIKRGLPAVNRAKLLWNVNPTLGGPILRNRLWFFATYTRVRSDNYAGGSFYNRNPAAWVYQADMSRQGYNDLFSDDEAVRLTWQASARNKIAFYFDRNYNCSCHFFVGPTTSPEAGVIGTNTVPVKQLTWTSPVTNRLLLEAGFSTVPQDKRYDPDPAAVADPITEQSNSLQYRANTLYRKENFQNRTVRGSASYVTAGHALKAGFTAVFGSTDSIYYSPFDNVSYQVLNGSPNRITYYGNPTHQLDYMRPNLGIYAQDQWSLWRMTLNGGLRFDYLRTGYGDHDVPPTQWVRVPRVFPGAEVLKWKDLSPRFGGAYDLFGNAKTAIKVSMGRYNLADGLPRRSAINPIGQNNSVTRSWTDVNRDYIVQGDPFNPALNDELGPSTNASFGQAVRSVFYDPKWAFGSGVRAYNWETSAGIQHELFPRVALNASYFWRWFGNFEIADNLAVTAADYDTYCVTAPSDARLPGGGGQQICGLLDLKTNKVGQINNLTTASNEFGSRKEHWNGFDLTVNARLARGGMVQGGVSSGKTSEDFCAIRAQLPEASYASAITGGNVSGSTYPWCRAETPFLTQVKVLGSYPLPWKLQVAGTFQSIPGPVVLANYVATSAQVAPSLGRGLSSATNVTVNVIEPGTLYGERLNQFDVRLSKIFTVGRLRAVGSFDLFNAFNTNAVLQQNNTYGTNGASWQVPQAVLAARLAKFTVQLNF